MYGRRKPIPGQAPGIDPVIDFPCMLRNRKASSFRFLLACSLCLLAVAFALEAKIAWYSLASDTRSEISFAKALPADAVQLVEHGQSATAVSRVPLRFTIAALIAVALTRPSRMAFRMSACNAVCARSSDYFSHLPSRAPPARS